MSGIDLAYATTSIYNWLVPPDGHIAETSPLSPYALARPYPAVPGTDVAYTARYVPAMPSPVLTQLKYYLNPRYAMPCTDIAH
eukprot:3941346-Rhodomonas_salina.3